MQGLHRKKEMLKWVGEVVASFESVITKEKVSEIEIVGYLEAREG